MARSRSLACGWKYSVSMPLGDDPGVFQMEGARGLAEGNHPAGDKDVEGRRAVVGPGVKNIGPDFFDGMARAG